MGLLWRLLAPRSLKKAHRAMPPPPQVDESVITYIERGDWSQWQRTTPEDIRRDTYGPERKRRLLHDALRKRKRAPVFMHGSCPVRHRSELTMMNCRNY